MDATVDIDFSVNGKWRAAASWMKKSHFLEMLFTHVQTQCTAISITSKVEPTQETDDDDVKKEKKSKRERLLISRQWISFFPSHFKVSTLKQ